ncbi:MAG: DUF445 domain-containing protein [bacterium]
MVGYKLFCIPVISGLIGWITNYLAVKMIFRPYKPINLFIVKIQGLMPKRKDQLAAKIGQTISVHLVTHQDIADSIKGNNLNESVKSMLDEKLEEFIDRELFAFSPLIASFVTSEIKSKIKMAINNEIIRLLPDLGERISGAIERNLDVKGLITDRVKSFDLHKLEKIILEISSRELKAIEIYGGVLGLLIGIIQIIIILL